MKMIYRFLTLFALLTLFLVPTGAVHAQGPGPDGEGRVIFGSNFTLESGKTFTGDLVVFGGNVTVEEDASLNGNLVIFGGTAKSNGQVNGDVVIIGGQVMLDEKAHVTGDVVTVDKDGYFYIVDRTKDMVNVSGYKVYTREIDDILCGHPGVELGATVGIPDPERAGRPGGDDFGDFRVVPPNDVRTDGPILPLAGDDGDLGRLQTGDRVHR